ncbi:MAG TPA: YedE family putative selenium transporter [Gemmataceae bacterium]|nr:YedE family putative selenium transporter [Gemmataceae bacterium]
MALLNRFFASRWAVIVTGAVTGTLAALLVHAGNPGNMGFCTACFLRDIAGAVGLHRAAVVQYIRPEIIGVVLGAAFAAILFGEFKPRNGSAPVVRFVLGMLGMIGALVFLGCTWRVYLRLGGGDWNAIPGILGLIVGVFVGVQFFKLGYDPGRSRPARAGVGWVMPVLMLAALALLIFEPKLGRNAGGEPAGPIFSSENGPGSQHAAVALALGVGLVIGFLAQRSRFCTIAGVRDFILMRDTHFTVGIVALVLGALVTNLALGQFKPGFTGQPVAHTDTLWNFAGMVLVGLAFTLAGGCPGRQLILAGEGDGDAAVMVLGMLVGAAFAHNFSLASSPAGPGAFGPAAIIVGLVVISLIGLGLRERVA